MDEAHATRREAYVYRCERRHVHVQSERLGSYLLEQLQESQPWRTSLDGIKWIYKPADGNKASGIKIFHDVGRLADFCHELGRDPQVGVIQHYLEEPWLLEYALEAGGANHEAFTPRNSSISKARSLTCESSPW